MEIVDHDISDHPIFKELRYVCAAATKGNPAEP